MPEWPQHELPAAEKELLGFYVTGHPLTPYAPILEKYALAWECSCGRERVEKALITLGPEELAKLAAQGRRCLMVGDGLNDGPALAAASVSASPSSAVDLAKNAADVVFQGDQLAPVAEILAIA